MDKNNKTKNCSIWQIEGNAIPINIKKTNWITIIRAYKMGFIITSF